MPIDLAAVNWGYVLVLAVLAFIASLIGQLIALGNRLTGAVLSAILFAAAFVGWTYYPHGLPLPTRLTEKPAPVAAPAPSATAPIAPAQRPANPVTTLPPAPSDVPPKPQ